MGIDAQIYAVGTATDADVAYAEEYMRLRVGSLIGYPNDDKPLLYVGKEMSRMDFVTDVPVVGINTMQRYYGPGYERGCWPIVYAGIRALGVALPELPIWYGGDYDAPHQRVTQELLDEIWIHWLSPKGDHYGREVERFNARNASLP